MTPLPREFFTLSPLVVAPALLGKVLVRRAGGGERRARIIETEAYLGEGDPAAHSAAGLTKRTAILFGEPGHAYIYLIYGIHLCLNVSTLPAGQAGGVLFRALAACDAEHRDGRDAPASLTGPGRLTRGLEITPALNGCDLTLPGALYLADDGFRPAAIAVATRVGIRKALHLPYRYFIEGHPAVSRPHGPVLSRLAPDRDHAIATGSLPGIAH